MVERRSGEMVAPALSVFAAVVSPECLCIWGEDALTSEGAGYVMVQVAVGCALHGPGAPFDACSAC